VPCCHNCVICSWPDESAFTKLIVDHDLVHDNPSQNPSSCFNSSIPYYSPAFPKPRSSTAGAFVRLQFRARVFPKESHLMLHFAVVPATRCISQPAFRPSSFVSPSAPPSPRPRPFSTTSSLYNFQSANHVSSPYSGLVADSAVKQRTSPPPANTLAEQRHVPCDEGW
jgi:hypothetical protein